MRFFAADSRIISVWVAEFVLDNYGEPTPAALAAYREWLGERYKPNTVSQRIQALNYFSDM